VYYHYVWDHTEFVKQKHKWVDGVRTGIPICILSIGISSNDVGRREEYHGFEKVKGITALGNVRGITALGK
jgi:hypothetical protein